MIIVKHCHKCKCHKPEATHDKFMKMANMVEGYTNKDDLIAQLFNNAIKGMTDDPEFKKAYEDVCKIVDKLDEAEKAEEEAKQDTKDYAMSKDMHDVLVSFAQELTKTAKELSDSAKSFTEMLTRVKN